MDEKPPRDHISLEAYFLALRAADEKFAVERDRRYAEVAVEREKALKIKEVADLKALELASEIQKYKDEKANELRQQIASERGLYTTHPELSAAVDKIFMALNPVLTYVATQQGRGSGLNAGWAYLIGAVGLAAAIVAMFYRLR